MSTLEVRQLHCRYTEEDIISDVSLTVKAGQIVALIGPNGAGKTTLMRAMCRVLKPHSGLVLLDGQDIWNLPVRSAARRIARVEQSSRIVWPFTVEQVVGMGRFPHRGWVSAYSSEDHRAIDRALRETGLCNLRTRPINTLSGGESQRALLARALAQTPAVMLLDEPVAHLDIKYKITILDLVRHLANEGLAVLVSLHDLNLAGFYADRVALLSHGKLFALGTPQKIINKENIEYVYETDVEIGRHPLNHRPLVTPIPSWMK